MTIINTYTLSGNQINSINSLIDLCKLQDGTEGIRFLESDMNEYPEFPCFYLLYKDSVLVSFLSIFIPFAGECEIYAYTLPTYRIKGYFTKLFHLALKQLVNYNIDSIYLVCEPKSYSGKLTLKAINANFKDSEYMMKFNPEFNPNPSYSLTLINTEENNYYETILNNRVIGKCNVDHSNFCSTIYNFEITSQKRGKGFGTETLLLILENLLYKNYKNIVLHLSGKNKAAYRLYTKNGFIIIKQIDYWKYDISNLKY